MTVALPTSLLVGNQLPEFVLATGDKLIKFFEYYYEYLEREGEINDFIKNARVYLDSDKTPLNFLNKFFDEVSDLPLVTSADKRIVAKHVYDLYKAKGSERAYELLFRILFDEEISIYYPSEAILKTSDGIWSQEYSFTVLIQAESVSATEMVGSVIFMRNSLGDTQAFYVSRVEELAAPPDTFEIFFTGELRFDPIIGDVITGPSFNATIVGSVVDVDVLIPGQKFKVGQVIELESASGTGARAIVSAIDIKGGIKHVKMLQFGNSYTSNFYVSVAPAGVFAETTGSAIVGGISTWNVVIKDRVEGFLEEGAVLKSDYFSETYTEPGYDGTFVADFSSSQIFPPGEDFSSTLLCKLGVIRKYPGRFVSSRGMISDINKMQDNFFNQQFSYVINSNHDVKEYRKTVNNFLHPSGLKMFGNRNFLSGLLTTTGILDSATYASNFFTGASTLFYDFTIGSTFEESRLVGPDLTFTRASSASRINKDGFIEYVGVDVPRYDYTLSKEFLGVMLEESRTNVCLYSQDFSNAVWTTSNLSVAHNSIVSPEGLTTGDVLTSTPGGYIRQSLAGVGNVVFSIYLKKSSPSDCILEIETSLGTLSSTISVTNEWARYNIKSTVGATAIRIYPSGNPSNGDTLDVFGAQVEEGEYETSYIQTTTSTFTRAYELITCDISAIDDPSVFTVFTEHSHYAYKKNNHTLSIANNDGSNSVYTSTAGIAAKAILRDADIETTIDIAPLNVHIIRECTRWKQNEFLHFINGDTTGVQAINQSIPANITNLNIGKSPISNQNLNGHIKKIGYYPKDLGFNMMLVMTDSILSNPTLEMDFLNNTFIVG